MNEKGWIKLWRKLLDSPVFVKPEILKVFLWCLLKATHEEYRQVLGCQEVTLLPGQFIFGRNVAANELNMKESTVRNYIDFLTGRNHHVNRQKDRELDISSFSNYSIVIVRNWNKYQELGQKSGQRQDTNKNKIVFQKEKYQKNEMEKSLDEVRKFKKLNESNIEETV
jgi:hypothetical protein